MSKWEALCFNVLVNVLTSISYETIYGVKLEIQCNILNNVSIDRKLVFLCFSMCIYEIWVEKLFDMRLNRFSLHTLRK